MNTKYVVIGAGPAAQAAAKSIRTYDKDGIIKFITKEHTQPYSPVALPYLLNGEMEEEALFGKGKTILSELKVDLVTGKSVADIDIDTKHVIFSDGDKESYDELLIATGATPTMMNIEGLAEEDRYVYRTFEDFKKISKAIPEGGKVLIYGAGLVAVEVSEKMKSAGYDVTIVVRSYLLRKYFSKDNVAVLEKQFASKGIQILSGTTIAKCSKNNNGYDVLLSNDQVIYADAIVLATGVSPNVLAEGKLEIADGGIKADEMLMTNVAHVYAAGDVAAVPYYTGVKYTTCPISPEAVRQGKIAGKNMAGGKEIYQGAISANYLRVFEENLFSIGEVEGQTEFDCEILKSGDDKKNIKLLIQDSLLIGVEAYGMKSIHPGTFRFIIENKISIQEDKELLLKKPRETASWLMNKYRDETKF